MWLTSITGIFKDKPSPFANSVPIIKDPINPGPLVNAIAEISFIETSDFFNAESTTGIIFERCALEANSGTTPPYFLWIFWLAITLDNTSPFFNIEAAVSSQDDSIPSIYISLIDITIFVVTNLNKNYH